MYSIEGPIFFQTLPFLTYFFRLRWAAGRWVVFWLLACWDLGGSSHPFMTTSY